MVSLFVNLNSFRTSPLLQNFCFRIETTPKNIFALLEQLKRWISLEVVEWVDTHSDAARHHLSKLWSLITFSLIKEGTFVPLEQLFKLTKLHICKLLFPTRACRCDCKPIYYTVILQYYTSVVEINGLSFSECETNVARN